MMYYSLQKNHRKEFQKQLRALFHSSHDNFIHFGSKDPLSLLEHPYSKELAYKYALKWGSGFTGASFAKKVDSSASLLASLFGYESASLFAYQDNFVPTLLNSLMSRKSLLIKDLSFTKGPSSPVEVRHFRMQSLSTLDAFMKRIPRSRYDSIFICVPSISSEDGALAPLGELSSIAKEYGALLIVDDTHALGLLGKDGYGLSLKNKGADLSFAHFGKQFGYYATYLASSREMQNYLLERSLFSMPRITPFLLGLIDSALSLIPISTLKREAIFKLTAKLSELLTLSGFTPHVGSSFVTLPFSTESEMKHFSRFLEENLCIVEELGSTLCFSLQSDLTDKEMQVVERILHSYKEEIYCEAL